MDLDSFGHENWYKEANVQEHITLISMGNPHVILVCEDPWKVPLEKVGPKIENYFSTPVNVHFAKFS